ncbi:MAG: DUF4360 domain-containing protein [Bacteriovoracaceae bacterium]
MGFKNLLNVSMVAVTLALTVLTNAHADDVALGVPGYGGNGCPIGTASVTLSPDSKSLTILFDQFLAEAGKSSKKTIDRKSCNLAIPIHVPNGFSVSIIGIDYRGFVSLPNSRAVATFNTEYFFAGMVGPRFQRNWFGPSEADYLFQNAVGVQALVWSPCGADTNIRVNTSMMVRNTGSGDALASVDSIDMQAGLIFHYALRACR